MWFFLEMRLLYVWYPDVGRCSRLGQWGTCSSSRGWIEGGRAGEVMWRLIGYTGWDARVTSIGSLLPGLWGRACFLSPQQFCEPQEQRMISLCPSTEHVSTVAPRTPDIAISSGPLTLKGKVVHMSPWLCSWITAWHMAAPSGVGLPCSRAPRVVQGGTGSLTVETGPCGKWEPRRLAPAEGSLCLGGGSVSIALWG